jgi:hypothetical protein
MGAGIPHSYWPLSAQPMSHCLDLLLPAVPAIGGLDDPAAAWALAADADQLRPYRWQSSVELRSYSITASPYSFFGRLPDGYVEKTWRVVTVDAPELRGGGFSDANDSLELLLRSILRSCDRWVLSFALECEQIDGLYRDTVEGAITRLRAGIGGRQREGFISYADPATRD